MSPPGAPPADLSPIRSEAIRWVIERALERGNHVVSLAEWTRALVAHMALDLDDGLKAEVSARWPVLEYFNEPGSPHNEPDEGYTEGGFAVSFPRPRPSQRID